MIKGPDHAAFVPLSVSQALRALNAKNVNVITNKLIQVNPGIEPSSTNEKRHRDEQVQKNFSRWR